VRCTHLIDGGGCDIYATGRPELCRDYRCLWHQGGLPDEGYRPDECGVHYAMRHFDEVCRIAGVQYVVMAYEVRKAALSLPENRKVVQLLSERVLVYCSSIEDRDLTEFHGPRGLGKKVLDYLKTKARYLHSPRLAAMEAMEEWPWFV